MTMTVEVGTGQLAELVKQIQDGNEVVLTQGDKPVARIVPATEKAGTPHGALQVRSLKGHRVLTSVITQSELAEELFSRP
jgi:antitoxin (DNA-binding transcriptional repressor) of toxin-antitoxin stability system